MAIFTYRPSRFCVLDEVDAPLDDANVTRFTNLIQQMSAQTQFIVITHNKHTMQTANTLYGITMEEAGVSQVVSVKFPGQENGDSKRNSKSQILNPKFKTSECGFTDCFKPNSFVIWNLEFGICL